MIIPKKSICVFPNFKSWIPKSLKNISSLRNITFIQGDVANCRDLQKQIKSKSLIRTRRKPCWRTEIYTCSGGCKIYDGHELLKMFHFFYWGNQIVGWQMIWIALTIVSVFMISAVNCLCLKLLPPHIKWKYTLPVKLCLNSLGE